MRKKQVDRKRLLSENWYWYLTGENKEGFSRQYEYQVKWMRLTSGFLPGKPRCFECNLPLSGPGSWLARARPSTFSPRLCSKCEQTMRKEEAGAEAELSMLFADVRGSTTLAETTTTDEFKRLIQQFYRAATEVLVKHNAMVNRLMGDQVIGLFVPRFAGSRHAKVAVDAALDILRATGHTNREGPWIPVGIGIHTGLAYVGAVGTGEGVNEIAVLGSAPNLAARLSSQAADGEVIISDSAAAAAELTTESVESRQLELKGINHPVAVRVLRLEANHDRAAQ
jgi:adenylate cyclase